MSNEARVNLEAQEAQEAIGAVQELTANTLLPDATSPETNEVANQEQNFYRSSIERHKAKNLELQNVNLQQNIEERRRYANKIFNLLAVWLASVFVIILFQGFSTEASSIKFVFNSPPKIIPRIFKSFEFSPKFKLSDKVLLALIGGTTLNVIGIFIVVANYLFPNYYKQNNNNTNVENENNEED